jgi:starch-binding outer membrane protein, SusD/RagB family
MKRHYDKVLAAAALCAVLIGCEKFLDKKPMGVESSATFFTTQSQALAATTAVYDVLGWRYSQEIYEWTLGDVCSDDAEKGGENAADMAVMQQVKEFHADAGNQISLYRWSEFYQGVYRANLVIHNVPAIDMDAAVRDRLLAEAKFLRGWFYFQLVKTFGAVPVITTLLTPDEY